MVIKCIQDVYAYMVHRPAYLLMTAPQTDLDAQPPGRFTHAWVGLMLLSIGWGLLACAAW